MLLDSDMIFMITLILLWFKSKSIWKYQTVMHWKYLYCNNNDIKVQRLVFILVVKLLEVIMNAF